MTTDCTGIKRNLTREFMKIPINKDTKRRPKPKQFSLKKKEFELLLPIPDVRLLILSLVKQLIMKDHIFDEYHSSICDICGKGLESRICIFTGCCIICNVLRKNDNYKTITLFTSPSCMT